MTKPIVNKPVTPIITKPSIDEKEIVASPKPVVVVIQQAIENHKQLDTTVPLHVIVRGAIATEYELDVSKFTLLQLVEYLVTGLQQQGNYNLFALLFPLTTEYTLATVGANPWDYKEATLKVINSLLKQFN